MVARSIFMGASHKVTINNLKKIAVHILRNDKLWLLYPDLQEKNINKKKEQYENDFQITLTDQCF